MRYVFDVLSDFFVNIAAGWLGLCIFTPNFTQNSFPTNIIGLSANLLSCTMNLVAATMLKRAME